MRRTLHLVTAADALALRPLHQQMLVTRMVGTLRRRLPGVDLDELAAAARPLFEAAAARVTDVARTLADRWPGVAPRDLGDALTSLLPLVQVPPRGLWRQDGPARNTTMESWLGRHLEHPGTSTDTLVLRYLAAYGPAASADVRAWSGLTGLRDAVERLRPQLRTFRDERGRELFDLSDGPLPESGHALHRRASCRPSTTPSSATTTAAGSSTTSTGCSAWRARGSCSSTAGSPRPGPPNGTTTGRPSGSCRCARSHVPRVRRWWARASGCSASSPMTRTGSRAGSASRSTTDDHH